MNPDFAYGASWEDLANEDLNNIQLDHTAESPHIDFKKTAQEMYRTIQKYPGHFLLPPDMQSLGDLEQVKIGLGPTLPDLT